MAKLKYKVLLKTDAMFLTRVLISILILISTLAPASLSTTCSTTVIPANCDLITLYNVFTGINSNINRNLYEGYGITTPVAPPATNQQNWLNNNCLLDLLNTNNTSGFPPLIIAANNGIYYNKTPTQTAVQLFLACGANPDTIVNYPPKFMDATALDWVIIHFNSATPGTIDYQTDQATIAALLPPVTT